MTASCAHEAHVREDSSQGSMMNSTRISAAHAPMPAPNQTISDARKCPASAINTATAVLLPPPPDPDHSHWCSFLPSEWPRKPQPTCIGFVCVERRQCIRSAPLSAQGASPPTTADEVESKPPLVDSLKPPNGASQPLQHHYLSRQACCCRRACAPPAKCRKALRPTSPPPLFHCQ